jgi:hypothetical protein
MSTGWTFRHIVSCKRLISRFFPKGPKSALEGALKKELTMKHPGTTNERRSRHRFAIQRDLRFKVLKDERVLTTGEGQTIDLSSTGVAFETKTSLAVGALMELSISWPVLLDETCLMRLVVFGHVVWKGKGRAACTIDRYEFRTQARVAPIRHTPIDSKLRRWVENADKDVKAAAQA